MDQSIFARGAGGVILRFSASALPTPERSMMRTIARNTKCPALGHIVERCGGSYCRLFRLARPVFIASMSRDTSRYSCVRVRICTSHELIIRGCSFKDWPTKLEYFQRASLAAPLTQGVYLFRHRTYPGFKDPETSFGAIGWICTSVLKCALAAELQWHICPVIPATGPRRFRKKDEKDGYHQKRRLYLLVIPLFLHMFLIVFPF